MKCQCGTELREGGCFLEVYRWCPKCEGKQKPAQAQFSESVTRKVFYAREWWFNNRPKLGPTVVPAHGWFIVPHHQLPDVSTGRKIRVSCDAGPFGDHFELEPGHPIVVEDLG